MSGQSREYVDSDIAQEYVTEMGVSSMLDQNNAYKNQGTGSVASGQLQLDSTKNSSVLITQGQTS